LSGNSCGNLTTSIAEIVVNDDPTIVTQPVNSQTVCQNAIPINLEVMQSAGNGTFLYQWYSNSVNNTTGGTSIFGATNSIYTPPTTLAGTKYYYCIITQNGATGCGVTSNTAAVIINIAPSFSSQPLSNTICIGQSATALSVTSVNGTGTAQYQWYSNTINSTIGGTAITSANSSTFQPSSSTIGTNYYYCIITFPSLSGGCGIITSNIAQVTINPKATIFSQNITICSSATFTITPTNSNGDIVPTGTSYTWSSPSINPIGSVTGTSAQSTPQNSISQTLINTTTSPATVTYTVTPITGLCIGSPFTIIVTVNPSTNPNAIKTDITCFSSNNGTITTNITGGIPFTSGAPYTIVWTGPNGFSSSQPNISGLEPGVYNLSVLDAGGCPISNNYTIVEPTDIVITTDLISNITCYGSDNGSIAITVSGGTGSYTYNWTKNGLPYAATEDISNLTPGNYIISVNDANNCGPKTASFIIIEPPILDVTLVSQTNVICYGESTGAITINAFGGSVAGVYNYFWTGPNVFTSTNQNLINIPAGTYNLTVTDDFGCIKNLSITITQSIGIDITYVTTPIVCYGDNNATINVSITGGNTPYQIQWSNLAVGLNQNNLSPGNYTITVTDNLGCQKVATINIPSPPIFDVNPVVTNISCFGNNDGSIVLNFVGGIAPVNLVWSDGSPAGITRNNLGPGTYSVIITDSKPCVISRTFTIIEPQPLILSANITNALNCSNANSGAINLLVSGGTPPFNYLWNNGTTTEDLLNIISGNYSVTVTDSRGCTKTAQYSITRPNPIVVTVNTNTTADCDTYTVTQNFAAQVTGGIPPYQLNWSSGTVSGSNNNLMTTTQNGLVVLTAVDAIGCSATFSFNVDIPTLGNPSFSTTSIGYNTYGIYSILDPIQFTSILDGNYTSIIWDFGDGTFSNELNPSHTYVNPKNYLVSQTVTYPFGCVYVKYLNLNIEKGYFLVVPTAFSPNNRDGLNDTFRPVTKALKKVQLNIYDTWGSLVYSESGDVIVGWNGKIKGVEAENGNYYAKVIGETFYGTIVMENQTFVLIK
jgi:gliding motility-associated-like protein